MSPLPPAPELEKLGPMLPSTILDPVTASIILGVFLVVFSAIWYWFTQNGSEQHGTFGYRTRKVKDEIISSALLVGLLLSGGGLAGTAAIWYRGETVDESVKLAIKNQMEVKAAYISDGVDWMHDSYGAEVSAESMALLLKNEPVATVIHGESMEVVLVDIGYGHRMLKQKDGGRVAPSSASSLDGQSQ